MQISAERSMRVDEGRQREAFWNAPNLITLGRIAAGPLLLLLTLFPGRRASLIGGLAFLAISLTDLLDGWLARRGGQVTRVGKLLDPLADKLLVLTALVLLVALDRIPLWGVPLVVLVLGREIAVTGLRAMASLDGVVLGASSLGKWKTGFQSAALTALIIHHAWLGLPMHALGLALFVIAAALTVWSGWDYFAAFLSDEGKPQA
jgi:CDP-diacylglycerol--glycerol-3-phosphate 3-phosphatidyltransferase